MPNGFQKLREKQKFVLKGHNDVEVNFGKYKGLSFKEISSMDPGYLQFLIDTHDGNVSQNVRERLRFWLNESLSFWI